MELKQVMGNRRSIRYFGQGYLAVRYGEQAMLLIRQRSAEAGIVVAVLVVFGASAFAIYRRSRR